MQRAAPPVKDVGANAEAPLVVLSHIISQLRPGADLNKVTLPTFILEPKSMLERITKYAFRSLYLADL